MANGWVIAGVAGAGVVGLALVLKARAQAATPNASVCDKLPAGSTEQLACKALGGINKVLDALKNLGDPKWAERDATNKALNGAVEIANGPASCNGFTTGTTSVPLQGSVLRFANGCTPFPGTPGWSKCAPGTKGMLGGTSLEPRTEGGKYILGTPARRKRGIGPAASWVDSVVFEPIWSQFLTGQRNERRVLDTTDHNHGKVYKVTGDPTTGVFRPDRGASCAGVAPPAGGLGGTHKGKPFTCGPGTIPDFTGETVKCVPPSSLPETQGGTGENATRGEATYDFSGNGCQYDRPTATSPSKWTCPNGCVHSSGKWTCPPGAQPIPPIGGGTGGKSTTGTKTSVFALTANPFEDVEA
jgi:hypothetical protein